MINLLKKLLFVCFLCFYYNSTLASSSSNFLISQSAFKNQDYSISLSNFSINRSNLSNENLLDNVVAAVIVGDMSLAEKISDEILLQDPNNQEAYIVKLTYFYQNGKFKEIDKIFKEPKPAILSLTATGQFTKVVRNYILNEGIDKTVQSGIYFNNKGIFSMKGCRVRHHLVPSYADIRDKKII